MAQLWYNEKTDRYEMNGDELHCGDCLEVLICDDGVTKWVPTRMESTDCGWYLVGLEDYQIGGLFAR